MKALSLPQGALQAPFLYNAGNDFIKLAIATLVLTVLSIFFLECGQQLPSQLLTQIGAGGLIAGFVSLMATAITS
ncbi:MULTISPECIES: hypothetical protein [Pseudomonas syringae group]|uniref:Uncharacterized protein n=1 Tax=Pseudomonas syringae pv. ribicola TaxID=55398 RepID=A0A3M2W630_PSESI|nr:hypothetical protein [Pseudomonas syringae group genomosp. 3]RML47007.1 hypothetical protein ALQ95_101268 [Pseudomonas syringae pv. ribicola]